MHIALFVHHPHCSVDSANGIITALSPQHTFKLFTKDQVEDTFFNDVDIIAIPGGIGDSDSFDRLMSNNFDSVKKYINSGGRYLGICMGAYWADQDYFNILDNARATQYITRPNTDTKRPHAKAMPIVWKDTAYKMYFYDGCAISGEGEFETIATYPNGDAMAVIQKRIGLIGCHPESSEYWYNKNYLKPHWHNGLHYDLLRDFVDQLGR